MVRIIFISLALASASMPVTATNADDYHENWTPAEFIEQVNECRASIVSTRAEEFKQRKLDNTDDEQFAHNEGIRATSMVDEVASSICFCRYNEFAKNHPPSTEMTDEIKKGIEADQLCGPFEQRFKERVVDSYDMEELMLD